MKHVYFISYDGHLVTDYGFYMDREAAEYQAHAANMLHLLRLKRGEHLPESKHEVVEYGPIEGRANVTQKHNCEAD